MLTLGEEIRIRRCNDIDFSVVSLFMIFFRNNIYFLSHGSKNVATIILKKKSVLLVPLFDSRGRFYDFGCYGAACQGHGFKQIAIWTLKKGVLIVAPLFNSGVDFKVFILNDIGC